MKKQFFRVKQLADQTFSRAEKSDVLTEDMVLAEKRVELIRQTCLNTTKKVSACLQGLGLDHVTIEKRQKKMPEILLSQSMLEASAALGEPSALGAILEEGGKLQGQLGRELFNYELEVERSVLGPLQSVLDNEIPNIAKLRKQLSKLTLDMDSARARYHTANRHSQVSVSGSIGNNKADVIREELEDASMKVEHCRDALAAEMYALLSRETELTQYIALLFKFQAAYHRNALEALDSAIPTIEERIDNYKTKPVFGTPLEEHLRVTNQEIATVIEMTVMCLYEYGMKEEGLFRIAGSASKVKKLKSEFDAGIVDLSEFASDPHTVAGALKSYLRELPEPLMTHSLYNEWMKASRNTSSEKRLQDLWQVVHQLPTSNYNNLRYLIKFLHELTLYSDINKMSSQNIAIVIPPNIIWAPSDDGTTMGMNMTLASTHSAIVDSLVTYADWFFPESVDFRSSCSIPKKESQAHVPYAEAEPIEEETSEAIVGNEIANKSDTEDCQAKSTRENLESTVQHSTELFVTPNNSEVITNSMESKHEEDELISLSEQTPANSMTKNAMADSPRVPKRQNKKAAPPIPKDGALNKSVKSASLDRSLSTRPSGTNRVVVERTKSYVDKSNTKPPLVRKAESASPDLQSDSAEDLLLDLSSGSGTTERAVSDNEENSPNTASLERRRNLDRPTEKPPLPPVIVDNHDVENNDSSRPERPPRSHSPNVTVMSDKQFCTVIQVQGRNEPGTVSTPVKVKPAKPPLPTTVKPRPNPSMIDRRSESSP